MTADGSMAASTANGNGSPTAAPAERPARILVVDDIDDNRELLRRRLSRRGFDVVEASDGFEALRVVKEGEIDLILLDIMMPGMDGTEVLRSLRAARSPIDLPVIMVSAKDQSEDVAHCLALGANDYVTKPVDFTIALARLQAHLDRRRDAQAASRRVAEAEAAKLERVVAENCETLRRTNERLAVETGTRRQSEERLEYLARHDPLTGLQNRLAFRRRLDAALGDAATLAREPALLFVDLDRFEAVNDVHGHLVGDQLLQDVAARLTEAVGDPMAVARLGGDEFGILVLEDRRPDTALELAKRILAILEQPFDVAGNMLRIGASCGVARAACCDAQPELMIKASDFAARRAKTSSRGRVVVFEPRLLEARLERSLLEVDLRGAIQREEMEVHYQPLIRTATNTLTCFEALLRWNHPKRGPVLPALFLPVAEETGLIHEIGLWALRQACLEAARWPSWLHVAVNLSPAQFVHFDLVADVRSALEASGLDPQRLELEVTEAGLLQAGARSVVILEAIRGLGVRVSIDDFGTGYSSMSYLQEFPFDKLKIDRRFVECLEKNANSSKIIKAIAQLGVAIGVETTAEGVETEAQFATAAVHGCSEIQGYHISRPLPPRGARAFIDRMAVR